MPKACSADLRERVLAAVEEGAARREAAERFEVSPSSAVKWFQAWEREGRRTAKPAAGADRRWRTTRTRSYVAAVAHHAPILISFSFRLVIVAPLPSLIHCLVTAVTNFRASSPHDDGPVCQRPRLAAISAQEGQSS
jgi:hypothetical protein